MPALATNLFREVSADLFCILANPLAGLYVHVLGMPEHEAMQRNHGLDHGEALALVDQFLEQRAEVARCN